ncbi:MAG TPA: acetate--CoA ligase family protein [Streptosporangiaceae bacterium]|nr:acetate--CoA ligase family protein [Streptosporangiaceae bacterium]
MRGPRAGLDAMFHPGSIAVVGASRDPGKWGRRILEYTGRAGYQGALFGVNPAVDDLGLPGVRTVPSLAAIGQPVDLAVLARPAAAVPGLVEECADAGVRSVLITAAGFGELGEAHRAAEQRIRDCARGAGMRVLGPNTFGLFSAGDGVNLTPREQIPHGPVALLTQSGNVAVALYEQAKMAGTGFSACVGVGNQLDIGLGELLAYFAADPGSRTVAVYVEGLRGAGADFVTGLAACQRAGKPVVVLKSGRSPQAAAAVTTHTGALASDVRVWEAVLAGHGAVRVESTQDMTDVLAVVNAMGEHHGRALVLTDGGGDSVMAVDALTAAGLTMAVPSARARAELTELIPAAAPRTPALNPVTLDSAGGVEDDPALLARCARVGAHDDGVDVVVIGGLFGGYPRLLDDELECADELLALASAGHRVAVQSAFALSQAEPVQRLKQGGVPVLPTMDRLARALSARLAVPNGAAPGAHGQAATPGVSHADNSKERAAETLPLEQCADLLREAGVTLPSLSLVDGPDELDKAAETTSYPACVKIADPSVSHKSEVGGVILDLADAVQLRAAGTRLWERFPGSPLLVMPYLRSGTEFLVGTGNDPAFGPFVMVGRGGIWAETDPDLAVLLAPTDEPAARRALLSLRFAPTFTGRRGRPAIDVGAMAGLVVAMSQLAVGHPELSVEVNPAIAYPDGYAIADLRASAPAG